MMNII